MYTGPDGIEYVRKVGSRQEVWDEVCFCTSGKLKRSDFIMKNNKIVSKRRSEMGQKRFAEKGNPFKTAAVTEDKPGVSKRLQKETPAQRRARRNTRRS